MGIQSGAHELKEIDHSFVNKELKRLVPTKGIGLDDISPRFLKDAADPLTNIVTYLINFSLRSKTVPDCIKTAKVTPLHKKNSKLEVGNYRPISVLSSLSKVLEKAVHMQVEEHCNRHNLLYQLQSGFRGNYSTNTCLIYLHDLIRKEISNGKVVGVLLLDVQKAFDSVDHQQLCKKIEIAGLDPTWFRSYLQNRKQIVTVNGHSSPPKQIIAGVPQGSILGPWFYLLYSNDIPSCLSSDDIKMLLYADDTILLCSDKDPNIVSDKLSKALSNCQHWFTNNKLVMHSGKTESILITSIRKQHLKNNYIIHHAGQTIPPSDSVKYLGLKIDNTLSGKATVDSILSKCNSRLRFMARYKNVLNEKTKKFLTSALNQ